MRATVTSYAPQTFAERGVAVPFTTPTLAQLRVRKAKDDLEVVIPGFAGGAGRYIVRWQDLPDVCAMTLHDRRLCEVIVQGAGIAPAEIRSAALVVGEAGFAGEDVQAAAKSAIKADKDAVMLANFALIIELMAALFGADRATVMRELATPQGQDKCRTAIAAEAKKIQLDHSKFLDDVAELSSVLVDVGAGAYREQGRLRRSYQLLECLARSLAAYATNCPSEAVGFLRQILLSAARTRDLTRAVFADIDGRVAGLPVSLHRLAPEIDSCARLATRAALLLDGWNYAAAAWDVAVSDTASDRVAALVHIAERVPVLPALEAVVEPMTLTEERASKRYVRSLEDWRHGGVDAALVERIEKIQARATQ